MTWLKGPSGVGKSTWLKLLSGLLPISAGEIQWGDFALSSASVQLQSDFRQKNIGYVHQENHLISHWTVAQNLKMFGFSREQISQGLAWVGLSDGYLTALCGNLSGGERQRISVLSLLLRQPAIALLDEPTSHLDDEAAKHLLALIASKLKKSTVIVVSHDQRLEKLSLPVFDFLKREWHK